MDNLLGKVECYFCGELAVEDPVKIDGAQYDCPKCGLYRISAEAKMLIEHKDVTDTERMKVKRDTREKALQGRNNPKEIFIISTDWLQAHFFEIFNGKSIHD